MTNHGLVAGAASVRQSCLCSLARIERILAQLESDGFTYHVSLSERPRNLAFWQFMLLN